MTNDCSLIYQFTKTTSSEHGENMCAKIVLNVKTKNNLCTQHVLNIYWARNFIYWTRNSMKHLLSYCGLVAAIISASEKGLPVTLKYWELKQEFPLEWKYTQGHWIQNCNSKIWWLIIKNIFYRKIFSIGRYFIQFLNFIAS